METASEHTQAQQRTLGCADVDQEPFRLYVELAKTRQGHRRTQTSPRSVAVAKRRSNKRGLSKTVMLGHSSFKKTHAFNGHSGRSEQKTKLNKLTTQQRLRTTTGPTLRR
jgi:hypothetical protein